MMQLHLDRNLAQRRPRAPTTPCCCSTGVAGWHTTGKLDVPDNITPIFLAPSPRPGAEPGRERLAVPPPELGSQTPRLRKLRRSIADRRMRGLAKAHRSTRNNHFHRTVRLGSRRSAAMTFAVRITERVLDRYRAPVEDRARASSSDLFMIDDHPSMSSSCEPAASRSIQTRRRSRKWLRSSAVSSAGADTAS